MGGEGGAAPGYDLLFDCGWPIQCVQDEGHLGPISDNELRCGGELLVDGGVGAILVMSSPGPWPTEVEYFTIVLGDGHAIHQSRVRCFTTDDDCGGNWTTEWSYSGPPELCDIDVQPEDLAGCGQPDGTCAWFGRSLSNCMPLSETWSCDELPPFD